MRVPDPNRYAGPAEAALLRDHIATEEDEIHRVHARLQAVSTMLHDAEQRLQAAQEEASAARDIVAQVKAREVLLTHNLLFARGLLHPIRRLPDDVLATIFLTWLAAARTNTALRWSPRAIMQVPFLAASVCRRWRLLALDTPLLWTELDLSFKTANANPAAWLAYVHCILKRSQKAPLALDLSTSKDETPTSRSITSHLLLRCHRWSRLNIVSATLQDEDFQRIMRCSDPLILESLTISISDGQGPASPIILPYAPRLRSLSLEVVPVSWSQCRGMHSLQEFTLDMLMSTLDVEDLAVAATKMPNLEKATINAPLGISGDPKPVTFSRLRRLSMRAPLDENVAQSFRCPRLEALEFSGAFNRAAGLASAIRFLQTSASHNTLKTLVVRFIKIGTAFTAALKLLENLEEATFHNCDIRGSFFRAMSAPQVAGTWIAPRLWRLHIRASPGLVRDDGISCDAASLQALVRARCDASSNGNLTEPCALRDVVCDGFDK